MTATCEREGNVTATSTTPWQLFIHSRAIGFHAKAGKLYFVHWFKQLLVMLMLMTLLMMTMLMMTMLMMIIF